MTERFAADPRVTVHAVATSNVGGLELEFFSNSADPNAPAKLQTGGGLGTGIGAKHKVGTVHTTTLDAEWQAGKLGVASTPPGSFPVGSGNRSPDKSMEVPPTKIPNTE